MTVGDEKSLGASVSVHSITLKVRSSRDIPGRAAEIINLFNQYGALVVEFEEEEAPRDQLLCFQSIFGNTMPHDRADNDMIAEIAVSEAFQGYLGTSNAEHPFHTDGAYSEHPPQVVALRCELAAKEGGVSRLATGADIYRYVREENVDAVTALSMPDALCVDRAGQHACLPVFSEHGDRRSIRYRADETTSVSNESVRMGMDLIARFLADEQNFTSFVLTHRQVLITDNTRTLHARTAFLENEPRKMHRLFFDGSAVTSPPVAYGFTRI